jgi:hypothetical protein
MTYVICDQRTVKTDLTMPMNNDNPSTVTTIRGPVFLVYTIKAPLEKGHYF